MRALTVIPKRAGSAELAHISDPDRGSAAVIVRTRAVGICGTDREILAGHYGWPPPGPGGQYHHQSIEEACAFVHSHITPTAYDAYVRDADGNKLCRFASCLNDSYYRIRSGYS